MEIYGTNEQFEGKELNLRDYWIVIWRRKWTIITFTLVIFAVVTFKTYLTRPTYTARGTLLIEQEPNILTFEQIFQIETFRDDFYQTQLKLLQSRSLADNTVERLKLYENPQFVGKLDDCKKPIDKSDPAVRRSLVDSFLRGLEVKPVRLTRLVEVNFKAHDPKFAASCVNALFDSFIDMNIETKYEATEQATEFLGEQIKNLREELERDEKKLQEYGAEKNIIMLSDKETTIVDKLADLNKALTEAQIDRVRKESYYNEIKIASPDYFPETLTNPLIQRLREEYVKLNREYQKMQEKFKPEYPEMQRLKTELESAKKLLENETQNLTKAAYSDYQAAFKKEKSLEAIYNRQKQEAIQLNSNAILYGSLKVEIENKKDLLDSLLRRQSETGVSARLRGLRTSNVRIVDRAEAPASPSSPRKRLNMIMALIIGLFVGLGLAFLFDYLDDSVKNADDVERYAGLPTLGVVPTFSVDGFRKGHYGYGYGYGFGRSRHREKLKGKASAGPPSSSVKEGKERSLVVSQQGGRAGGCSHGEDKAKAEKVTGIELIPVYSPKSNFSESYRSIRIALLLSSAEPNLKCIAVSSSLPEEGKTATVANLAVTLAQADKKVLIVDSDFRKPRLHRIFKVKNLNGLTNYLSEHVELKDLIKQTEVSNLYLINSGPLPPNPAELLGSEKMANLIENLKQYFNYILFDTPPILAVTDAMVLGPKIDGMILIVCGEKTSREALRRAREKLDLTKIKTLGVVLNNINLRKHNYYYKHYYYHYYYGE